jgi:hypothetical protein
MCRLKAQASKGFQQRFARIKDTAIVMLQITDDQREEKSNAE